MAYFINEFHTDGTIFDYFLRILFSHSKVFDLMLQEISIMTHFSLSSQNNRENKLVFGTIDLVRVHLHHSFDVAVMDHISFVLENIYLNEAKV